MYVALAGGQASAEALAGQTLRLADWYVRLKNGEPDTVVNETYSLVRFDAQGRVDWAHSPVTPAAHPQPDLATVPEDAGWPTASERERMCELLFGGTTSSGSPSPAFSDGITPLHCSNSSPSTSEPPCR